MTYSNDNGAGKAGFGGFSVQQANGFQVCIFNFLKLLSFSLKEIAFRSFCLLEIQGIQVVLFKKVIKIASVFT